MVITVRSPSRAMTTCEEWLNSLASPLATKKPQNASAPLGASDSAKRIARHRNHQRLIMDSLRRRMRVRSDRAPQEPRTGQQEVEERHGGRKRGQGPQEAVGPEQTERDEVRDNGHAG